MGHKTDPRELSKNSPRLKHVVVHKPRKKKPPVVPTTNAAEPAETAPKADTPAAAEVDEKAELPAQGGQMPPSP